ncbi:MAG: energy-coupling factor ABC transporter substrate-binding protein [Micropruina sp.]|nr:energy-coupling factor ABC transporter substrate-binding protein [Micropruina sp.]
MSRKAIVNWCLALAMVAVFAVSFLIGGKAAVNQENPDERFAGTDSKATSQIQEIDPSYEPWFSSVFQPGSGELESGLFALQAAIGGSILGFAVGAYWGRRRAEKAAVGAPSAPSGSPAPEAGS